MASSSGDSLAEYCQCPYHTRQAELLSGGLLDPIAFSHCWQQFFSLFVKTNTDDLLDDNLVYNGFIIHIFRDVSYGRILMKRVMLGFMTDDLSEDTILIHSHYFNDESELPFILLGDVRLHNEFHVYMSQLS